MKPYLQPWEETLRALKSSEPGLSQEQAAARLREIGPNKLKEAKKESVVLKFLKELRDPMTLVLIGAAIVSAVTALYAGESLADTVIILAVILAATGAMIGYGALEKILSPDAGETAVPGLLALIAAVQDAVKARSGILLETEVRVLGED